MRVLTGNGLVVAKSGNRNTSGTGEAGPSDRNGGAGVTSSRSGVSATYGDGRGAYRSASAGTVGDGGGNAGKTAKAGTAG